MLPSVPFDPAEVLTTHTLDANIDMGKPMLNNYIRYAKVGGGQHGEVYLCYKSDPKLPTSHPEHRIPVVRLHPILHLFSTSSPAKAMKSVRRDNPRAEQLKKLRQRRLPSTAHTPLADRLNTTEAKIRKEIAIMKKCRHPHVVRLYEVIDDRMRDKIYMGPSQLICLFNVPDPIFTSHGVSRRRRSKMEKRPQRTYPYRRADSPDHEGRCSRPRIPCASRVLSDHNPS